ncbi:hypothetical protein ZMTM_05000 [Methyloradius palustris]|uniref:Polysaccharide biosynthesis protein C-terminal domain-containing protein n=2 Tax=Methyloradius palustris TaxID=2778876 RepID=A0A8D5G9S2_9PROT|nr:hypothetical protein ZMTM_05000 [Methyloradius palustris]
MTGLFIMRYEFIDFSLGSRWTLVATLLGILAPVGFMQAIGGATGPVFMAQGKTSLLLKFGIFSTVIYVLAFILGSSWGVVGVAIGYLIACVFVTIPTIYLAQKSLGLAYLATYKSIFPSVLWALLAAAFVSLIKEYFLLSKVMFIDLTLQTLIGGSVYLIAMFYLAKPYFINIMKR